MRLRYSNIFIFSVLLIFQSITWSNEFLPNEVLVKLKSTATFPDTRGYLKSAHALGLVTKNKSWSRLQIYHLKLAPGLSVASALANIKTDPDVVYAEPNYIVRVDQLHTLGLLGGSGFSQSSAPIQVDEAWSILTADLPRPVVAIIDTGVDINHEVFTGSQSIWTNPNEIAGNGIDDDGNGYIDDVNGWNFVSNNNQPLDDQSHGTHVAGIALGVTQNIFANPLEKSKILIMPLKFLDSEGAGSVSDAIDAINYAVNNGAQVLNNSWGGPGSSQALLDAIKYSKSAGRAFVAAAGNDSTDNDISPIYPASYSVENLVAVTATTDSDLLASFSNFGFNSVHLGAPGQGINSTLPGNSYGNLSGTSMATPFVAGTIALMMREKSIDGVQAKGLLLSAAEKISGLAGKVSTEARLNVYRAVIAAQDATIINSTTLSSSAEGETGSGGGGGGCGLVQNGSSPIPPSDRRGLIATLLLLLPLVCFFLLRRRALIY